MNQSLSLQTDPEIFKLKEPRIHAFKYGRISLRGLSYTIHPGDWLVWYQNTLYALTPAEYYASQRLLPPASLSKEQFKQVLLEPGFSSQDAQRLEFIKKHQKGCSVCQYNRFKHEVLVMLDHYPELKQKYHLEEKSIDCQPYPETIEPVVSKISQVLPHFFTDEHYERQSCFDCVEKHIAMAYVKSTEVPQGYPEHFALALANLEEAYEECPKDCEDIREMLMFCIGKSKQDHELFVPLGALLYALELSKYQTKAPEARKENEINPDYSLDFKAESLSQAWKAPLPIRLNALKVLSKLQFVLDHPDIEHASVKYQGLTGELADVLLPYCPDISNVIRNRRLMFKVSPKLVKQSGFDFEELKKALETVQKVQEKNGSDS